MKNEEIIEIGGIAMAGELVIFRLIGVLFAKGILSKEETAAIYEDTLTTLEEYPKNDPLVAVARRIIDQMGQIAAKGPKGGDAR